MLKSKQYEEFWSWYFKPAPTSMLEEAALKVDFLNRSKLETYRVYLDWLVQKGSDIEFITLDPTDKLAIVNGDLTDVYNNEVDLLVEIIERASNKLDGTMYTPKVKIPIMTAIREVLYSVDSKGKIRVFDIELSQVEDIFVISRRTGIYDGKMIDQPVVNISTGKVKRTPLEQATLQYNSYIKSQKDKGYKSLEDLGLTSPDDLSGISESLGTKKTSVHGYNKPQGAKDWNTLKKREKVINGDEYIHNDKIDGIRTTIHLEDGELVFKSRGGGVFKGVTNNFKDNVNLKAIITKYKGEVDGEFYRHGLPLNVISGACRLDDYVPDRHDCLQLYIFDIADEFRSAKDRSDIINILADEINDDLLVFVKQTSFTTMEEFDTLHADALERGFEGSIIKKADQLYQFGKKSSAMWKRKDFMDEEFEVTGYNEGLRPIEDMVFCLKTKEGASFEAKPFGDRKTKEDYVANMDSLVGQFGTVKFFYYTTDGIPYLPSFVSFRPIENGEVQI